MVTLSDAVSLAAYNYNVNFLKGQGYDVSATLMQDNMSTMKLAQNGRSTSDQTSKKAKIIIYMNYVFCIKYPSTFRN